MALKCGKNVIIFAPSGYGKSTLAEHFAKDGVYISTETPIAPLGLLNNKLLNGKRTRLVVDEIHVCNQQEQFAWPLFLDRFNGQVIFTSTEPQLLEECIKTRCFQVILEEYSTQDLAQISEVPGNAGIVLARISRGIPRLAKQYGRIFSKYNSDIVKFVTDFLGMRPYKNEMLFPNEFQYIKFLETTGRASRNVLKNLNIQDLDFVEFCLLKLNLIKITSKGRELNGEA